MNNEDFRKLKKNQPATLKILKLNVNFSGVLNTNGM